MPLCYGLLICPVCGASLARERGTLVCPTRHRFDIARQGYVNLLVGGRRPALLGDSAEMLRARRAFLDRGHFAPLIAAIVDGSGEREARSGRGGLGALVGGLLDARSTGPGGLPVPGQRGPAGENNDQGAANGEPAPAHAAALETGSGEQGQDVRPGVLLEAGCGEGTYLEVVHTAFGAGWCAVGTDASKDAARLAAARHRQLLFVVADTWQRLPLADGSVDVLLNVFAPRNGPEFARLVRPGGTLLVVIPSPEHLVELRGVIPMLGIEPDKPEAVVSLLTPWFALLVRRPVRWQLDLVGDDLALLAAMTPGRRHTSAGTSLPTLPARIAATAAVELLRFTRISPAAESTTTA